MRISPKLEKYASQHHLTGITPHTLEAISARLSGYSLKKAHQFIKFHQRIQQQLLNHSVIAHNEYTRWFSSGDMSLQQLKSFVVQFSVFSNLFILAQLQKTINADSLQSMRASKEILMNELGVAFKKDGHNKNSHNKTNGYSSGELPVEGSIEAGEFHFNAAHFEWLYKLADALGLAFMETGKRRHGTADTLFYCDELSRLYASEDYTISQAASFAVENWAAAGFWAELIQGLEKYQSHNAIELPIFFFTYHDKIESQHAQHTLDELEDIYFMGEINEDVFIQSGNEMLDAVEVFWNGLNKQRKSRQH